jgi:hypothetical protein
MFFKKICLVLLTALLFGCDSYDSSEQEGNECQFESTYYFGYSSGTDTSLTAAFLKQSVLIFRGSTDECENELTCPVR